MSDDFDICKSHPSLCLQRKEKFKITNSKNVSSRILLKCDSNRIKYIQIGASISKWVFLPLIFR